jgi:hypothetical protein
MLLFHSNGPVGDLLVAQDTFGLLFVIMMKVPSGCCTTFGRSASPRRRR